MNFSLKAKLLKPKSEGEKNLGLFCFLIPFVFFITLAGSTYGQVESPIQAPEGKLPAKLDTIPQDSLALIKSDTSRLYADTTHTKKQKDAIETTITYSARDSINSGLDRKVVKLYGEAKIKYGAIQLEAEQITIDYETSTITAHAGVDSLGNSVGYPIFMNGQEKYETKDIVYNFKTKKAKISNVVTTQGDAFLHGKAVFKNEKNELFSISNGYTTCNLAHPHYRIISTKAKAIPGDKMVSGPFYMEFNDIPTPIGFLFGIFPSQRQSSSGIIIPAYGEESNRGFFLRGGGYFFDISDYVKLSIMTDIYSKGSSGLHITSTYKKRYKYGGNFDFNYTNNRVRPNIEDNTTSKDFRLTWSHSPQTKGTGRFSASVNAATGGYNSNNYLGVNTNTTTNRIDNTTANLSSNVSYSKTFAGTPFSMGVNLRINQNLITKQVDLPLPDMNFNVNNIYPFKWVKNSMVLQNLSTRVTTTLTNQVTNNLGKIGKDPLVDSIAPFNFQTLPDLLARAKRGLKSSIPLGTSFKLLKYFTLSPSVTVDETMYLQKLDWGLDATGRNIVVKDTIKGFSNITNYAGNISLTTRIYGTKFFSKEGRIQAIRHIINPSVGMNFSPDFAAPKYDYFQRFDVINSGVRTTTYKSRYEGFVYGGARQGKSQSMSFSVNNNIEMKVKSKKDTVAKKIPLFNTLSIGGSYNFAATSYKLSNLAVSANTNILNSKINVNFSGTIDPYQYIVDSVTEAGKVYERKRDGHYTLRNGFSSANFAFSTNLNPKGQSKDTQTRDKIGKSALSDSDKKFLIENPDAYVDFSIPWNLRLNYNASFSKPSPHQNTKITQAMRVSGDISLTPKWKIDFNTGYDFQLKQITATNLGIRRDLHCWQMSLNWVPFGRFQQYGFSIGIKSAMLRDLKLDRNRNFNDVY